VSNTTYLPVGLYYSVALWIFVVSHMRHFMSCL